MTSQKEAGVKATMLMGDDIGYWNISAYNRGGMGYRNAQHRPVGEGMEMLMKGKGSNAGVCTTRP